MKRCFSFIQLLFIVVVPFNSTVQDLPFEAEIGAFEQADRTTPPAAHPILFIGSSSIRFWDNLADYFPDKPVLQRGFGGSQLSDVLRYADRIIVPYKPKQIVLYAGENDIASGQTAQQTCERFVALFQHIRRKLPHVPLVFISLKPSPSRRPFLDQMNAANQLIKQYLAKQSNTRFVDIRPVMLDSHGEPAGDLFKADSLHMLDTGYQRWATVLRPYLN